MALTRHVALGAAAAAVALVPASAAAKDGDIIKRVTCSQGSTAKLKLSEEDGRIETEFEVDQNRNGVRWNVTLRRNGAVAARTAKVTRGPSGSFEVRRLLANGAGDDVITARATRASGEVCRARATFG
jgi:hypothetical protein